MPAILMAYLLCPFGIAINWVSQSETTAIQQALISKRYTASVLLQALAQSIQQI
jgi:hypothetical protein